MIRGAALALFLLFAWTTPAAAWDPYWVDRPWEEPVVFHEPQEIDHVWWWQDTAWEPAPPPPPVPVVPSGIYYVTEVYVADVVSVSGPVTTYSTATIADTPGTYARIADTVGTGAASSFDGAAFNGRATLTDGRQVAGTYYENFILSDGSFVPVSIVFFQDDSAIALAAARTPAPPTPSPSITHPAPLTPPPARTPSPAPTPSPGAGASPTPTPFPGVGPTGDPRPAAPPPGSAPVLRPGVAPSPLGDLAVTLEVLRGRAATVWFRAVADGVTVPVSSWRIVSGEHTALGATSGGQEDPFRARWDVVTGPTQAWILRLEATVVVDGIVYPTSGDVAVFVRSPALIR